MRTEKTRDHRVKSDTPQTYPKDKPPPPTHAQDTKAGVWLQANSSTGSPPRSI